MNVLAVTVALSKEEIVRIFNCSDFETVNKELGEKVREAVIDCAFKDILREVGVDGYSREG